MVHGKSATALEDDMKQNPDGEGWFQMGVPKTSKDGMNWRDVMRVQQLLESPRKDFGVYVGRHVQELSNVNAVPALPLWAARGRPTPASSPAPHDQPPCRAQICS